MSAMATSARRPIGSFRKRDGRSGHEERGDAARDRIDQRESARRIGVQEKRVVEGVAENVPGEIGKNRAAGEAEKRQERERHDSAREIESRELDEGIPARFHERVPRGVHDGREKDQKSDPEAHGPPPRRTSAIPARVKAIPGIWRATSRSFQMSRE